MNTTEVQGEREQTIVVSDLKVIFCFVQNFKKYNYSVKYLRLSRAVDYLYTNGGQKCIMLFIQRKDLLINALVLSVHIMY